MSPRSYVHPNIEDIEFSDVLAAVSDPIRLEMVKRLADGEEHDSLTLADDLPRSTLSYHTRQLREAGVTFTRGVGRSCVISLRTKELDSRFPGFIAMVIAHA